MNKLSKFLLVLDENGEMFFTSGDPVFDLQQVENTLKSQGYWAGGYYRYYFDENMDLVRVEERRFGNG